MLSIIKIIVIYSSVQLNLIYFERRKAEDKPRRLTSPTPEDKVEFHEGCDVFRNMRIGQNERHMPASKHLQNC